MPQVGSINDRLSKYQSASSPVEDKREDQSVNKPKVGKLADRKDSYLKQANNSSSPSHAAVSFTWWLESWIDEQRLRSKIVDVFHLIFSWVYFTSLPYKLLI